MNVLLINGHPRKDSLTEALVHAYAEGARTAGVHLETLVLTDLTFDPNVTYFTPSKQLFEPDIERAQELILWADHVVFIYPTWWGTMPALLKGFIDRVFTAGFAFDDIDGGTGYAPLLSGKSAQIITTMDTPLWVYRWVYRSPGHNAMRRAILQFCGFEMARTQSFGPVKSSTEHERNRWLQQVKNEGLRLKNGSLSSWTRFTIKTWSWLKAVRLQFYPMTFIAYATGAFAAENSGYSFKTSIFWLGYLWLFLVELATVLTNDYLDFKSDKQNNYFSAFTGGSRVIVDKLLSFSEIKKGIFVTLFASVVILALLLLNTPRSLPTMLLTCAMIFVLALGYTVPPLKLSYRGLGELTVGLTHSFAAVVCGYLFQGGKMEDPFPWLLSLPMFFAVLPSIILSGIPDFHADKAASKKTLAVRFGKKGAAVLALGFTLTAAITVVIFKLHQILPDTFGNLFIVAIPHATLLSILLWRYIKNPDPLPRIDTLMIASLTYLIWFGLFPLIHLWSS